MSHTVRPRAFRVTKTLHQSTRTISSTRTLFAPQTDTEAGIAELPVSSSQSENPLSTRSSISAYLRLQNDAYLDRLKHHLKSTTTIAEVISEVYPELCRQHQHIRPSSTPAGNSIPPYTVLYWKRSFNQGIPRTEALLKQVERVVKNIEDLGAEEYRADVTLSKREQVQQRVADLTTKQKEDELMNAGFYQESVVARFSNGLARLGEDVKAIEKRREEMAQARERNERQTAVEDVKSAEVENSVRLSPVLSPNDSATSYTPMVAESSTASKPRTEGWGDSTTKIEERGRHIKTENPFKRAAPPTKSKSGPDPGIEALRKRLHSVELNNDAPKSATESESNTATNTQQEPKKAPSLFERQRMLNNASQGKR